MPLGGRSYFVQKSFKNLLQTYHDFFMIATYTITISRTTAVSQCTSAYKIFFIILELIKQFISSPPFYPLIKQETPIPYDGIGIWLSA
ncbi:hypothetical protein, partial [Turicimonas muris]|uniref:hypothetical protein n=1 Tax=Turicimonas muris TaxID=1796652 RepID=UPI0026312932